MKVLVLTKYANMGASSRERFFLYFERLKKSGIDITWSPLLTDEILKLKLETGVIKKISLFIFYLKRIKILICSKKYDAVWLESEGLPHLPFFFEKLTGLYKKSVVVNYDDAVFHNYDLHKSKFIKRLLGNKISKIIGSSHTVVVGNDYLECYARLSGARNIVQIPTVVDTDVYLPTPPNFLENQPVKIGWLGSPSTQYHLALALPAIKKLQSEVEVEVELHVMGVNENFDSMCVPVTIHAWSETAQLDFLNSIDIGIMPLIDSPFARGKCGYKLIQYMAYQKPVVATPLEINNEIVNDRINGFYANTDEEWFETLKILCLDRQLQISMGENGREKVDKKYSINATFSDLLRIFQGLN